MYATKEDLISIIEHRDIPTLEKVLDRVVNQAIEKALLSLPAVTAKLIKTSIALDAMTADFLASNPGFEKNKEIVHKIVLQTEAANPGKTYGDILKLAKDEIIRTLNSAATASSQPALNFKDVIGSR